MTDMHRSTEKGRSDLTDLLDTLSIAIGETGIPQSRLAALAGLSEKHVSQMMTGRVDGSLSAWQRLMDAADVRISVQVISPGSQVDPE